MQDSPDQTTNTQSPLSDQTIVSAQSVSSSNLSSKIIIIAIILLLSLSFAYLFYQNYQLKQSLNQISQPQISLPQPTAIPVPDPTADWKVYTNTAYNFSIKYPKSWEAVEDTKNAPVAIGILEKGLNFEAIFLDKARELACGPYDCYPSVQIATPIKDNNKIKPAIKDWVINYIKSQFINFIAVKAATLPDIHSDVKKEKRISRKKLSIWDLPKAVKRIKQKPMGLSEEDEAIYGI